MRGKDVFRALAVSGMLLASCYKVEEVDSEQPSYVGDKDNPGKDKPQKDDQSQEETPEMTYMCWSGIEYPEGYDWMEDPDYGQVDCRMFLNIGGKRVLEIPVGSSSMVSPDPLRHRLIDGHIYTDFVVADSTVIKRDGVELLRFAGAETEMDIIVKDSVIYTLGRNVSGRGFAFRKNGVEVLKKTSSFILHGLHCDSGKMCFSYYDQLGLDSSQRPICRYYSVCDAREELVGGSDDYQEITDIMMIGGVRYMIAKVAGTSPHILFADDYPSALELGSAKYSRGCRLHNSGTDIYITGQLAFGGYKGDELVSAVWKGPKIHRILREGLRITDVKASEGRICYITSRGSQTDGNRINWDDSTYVATGFSYISQKAILIHQGTVTVALNHKEKSLPYIWDSDSQTPACQDFNGYISHISLCER